MRSVRSRVVPAGTTILLNTIAVQEVFPLTAAAAVVKVQDARSASALETGAAITAPALTRSPRALKNCTMLEVGYLNESVGREKRSAKKPRR